MLLYLYLCELQTENEKIPMTLESASSIDPAGVILMIWLYAEIHYRLLKLPSRLYRPWPEIVADVPRRIDPRTDVPILLLIKDAHRFPLEILEVRFHLYGGHGPERTFRYSLQESVQSMWWHRIFVLHRHFDDQGERLLDVECVVRMQGKRIRVRNDNYPFTSHSPFKVYFASDPLPGFPGMFQGDLHTHSNYTSDQVEFGAPLPAMVSLARASGLQFLAVTDHSYDLDDVHDDYLRNDPSLQKWEAFLTEVEQLNSRTADFVLIPGEEVSCGNAQHKNVHFLVLNQPRFIPGSGDSGEQWPNTAPELHISDILQRYRSETAAYFAAHPRADVPFLERLLLGRGRWEDADLQQRHLTGLQIWNGEPEENPEAEWCWIRLLLQGRRASVVAGSDGHGNFNRYRQLGLPHLWMVEREDAHLIGMHRTLIHAGRLNRSSLMEALIQGKLSVTSGPAITITGIQNFRDPVPMGGTLNKDRAYIHIRALSSEEFGALQRIILYRGDTGAKAETVLLDVPFATKSHAYETLFPVDAADRPCYYRAEVRSRNGTGREFRALTNPIWHESRE